MNLLKNEEGVGKRELSQAAKDQAHIALPEAAIKLEKPIKELGTFDIPVSVGEIFGKFTITIEVE